MKVSCKKLGLAVSFLLSFGVLWGQEIGANFNHNPEIIDFKYLEKSKVDWVRATPRILEYVNGTLEVDTDPGLAKIVEAGKMGYKVAFGLRWDFNKYNLRIPEPDSPEEKELFKTVTRILEKVGPYVDIFKLGNEPNLETMSVDMRTGLHGYIPLVRFTERLLEEAVEPFYNSLPELVRPAMYVGSFPRLFMKNVQENQGVIGMIKLANNHPAIQGLAIHLHISSTSEIIRSFEFVRGLMLEKPIIVPEFSFHRLYVQKLNEPLVSNQEGAQFVQKYDRNPNWKLYDWFGYANTHRVSQQEWVDLFETLEWFPKHSLLTYYEQFQKYGVVLATYPLFQQSAPRVMTANSPAWFINPIFGQKSLQRQDGEIATNPLHFEDFLKIVEMGKEWKTQQ